MTATTEAIKINRIYFLDNLRTFTIFLVVLYHSGLVYENSGIASFFWVVHDSSTNNLSTIPNLLIIDIFVMSVIFFISGYLTPLSLKNKNGWAFLNSKFKRLMIPWIIAVLILIPLYKILFLYSRNLPQENWTSYFHGSNGIISQSWLWFLPVLFLFDILYLLFLRFTIKLPDISLKTAVGIIFLLGFIYSFCFDVFGLMGWTKTVFIDFQNERLFIYFMIFLLGSLCFKLKIFESKPESKKLYAAVLCTVWIPVLLYRFFYIRYFVFPGDFIFSKSGDVLFKWLNFHLSLLFTLYLMIQTFRYFLDKQGKIRKALNKNSYNVYIIHTIVLGGIAVIMLNIAIPSLIKFFVLTGLTYLVSNLLVYFYREVIKSKLRIKKRKTIMKTVTTGIVAIMLLTSFGCGAQEKSSSSKNPPGVSIYMAALQGNLEAIQQHINAGTDLNKKDEYGSTPLNIAITFDKTEVATALINAGADITIRNNDGSTPLHVAAFLCRTEIVKALLDKGADKSSKNAAGHTALETVTVPFEKVKGIYDRIGAALQPLGLKLDYERIKMTRPKIAEMLE